MKNSNFGWALLSITLFMIGIVATIIYVQASTIRPSLCDSCSRTPEKLIFNNVTVTSPTNIRLNISDTGSISIQLALYFINNTRSDSYANRTWFSSNPGPYLYPGGSLTLNLSLSGTLTGQPFQFQSGQAYTVELVTTRNNAFTYTFTT